MDHTIGYDYDVVIIGSGFGGSVSALRLCEKGYSVAILEQGRSISKEDMLAAENPAKLFWLPKLGFKGFFSQNVFQHVGIVGGVGVGGGSLVYAAVLIQPSKTAFNKSGWSDVGIDWANDLEPHYATAIRMLDRVRYPYFGEMDEYLKKTAQEMKAGDTFGQVPLGIYFGKPEVTEKDPYFEGRGPQRTGCKKCGACLTGCPYDAKNSLDSNYLYLAQKLGAKVFPEHKVTIIKPLSMNEGFIIDSVNPFDSKCKHPPFRARKVIISAGVLGSLSLLFQCRDVHKTLPLISSQLGKNVRTNSEAIVGILSDDADIDLTNGTTISTDFYPNEYTHITQNRFPKGYSFMKWYMGPLVDGDKPFLRAIRTLLMFVLHPIKSTVSWRATRWYKRINILTVMQHLDNRLSFRYERSIFSLFQKGLRSIQESGSSAPTYIPEANQAARIFSRFAKGTPLNVWLESILNMSITAHILGGCQIGSSRNTGVINANHEVFGYPGLFIVDASAIPANLGVNPALTITALAERCMSLFPEKKLNN